MGLRRDRGLRRGGLRYPRGAQWQGCGTAGARGRGRHPHLGHLWPGEAPEARRAAGHEHRGAEVPRHLQGRRGDRIRRRFRPRGVAARSPGGAALRREAAVRGCGCGALLPGADWRRRAPRRHRRRARPGPGLHPVARHGDAERSGGVQPRGRGRPLRSRGQARESGGVRRGAHREGHGDAGLFRGRNRRRCRRPPVRLRARQRQARGGPHEAAGAAGEGASPKAGSRRRRPRLLGG
mmetsp:Transcript_71030/g.219601  ORF Transcript_71030/g.219601 Transcript_71030/m.219601 type:complete len:237 (-) Transcript_71030:139-849(-)